MDLKKKEILNLKLKANNVRNNIIKACYNAGSGHPGGSLSSADLILVLFAKYLNLHPENIKSDNRDRFILSKGHASPLLYSILAEFDFIEEKLLTTFRKINSRLQGHPSSTHLDCIDVSTGSLGQGLSIASGLCLGLRLDKINANVYCLIGDGEIQEGQIWEAISTAAHYKLDNLCAIIDYNKLQIDGFVKDVKNIDSLEEKFRAFNWEVLRINGHNYEEISYAYETFLKTKDKPYAIIADTIKGKNISFMENQVSWHGKAPDEEQFNVAIQDLESIKQKLIEEMECL